MSRESEKQKIVRRHHLIEALIEDVVRTYQQTRKPATKRLLAARYAKALKAVDADFRQILWDLETEGSIAVIYERAQRVSVMPGPTLSTRSQKDSKHSEQRA